MGEINNIHDTFFRESMSHKEVAVDFLANYLPSTVLRHIQLDTLAITKDTFVDKNQAQHFSDLLYRVKLTGNRVGFVYFLFEHKSYPDRFVVLQLLGYINEIWELFRKQNKKAKKLPLIIPIVMYHGKPRGKATRLVDLVDLPDPDLAAFVPDFDLAFYDFSPGADLAIKGQILSQLFLHCLQAKYTPETHEKFIRIIQLLAQLDEDASSMHWVQAIFRYILSVMDIEPEVVHDLVRQSLSAGKEELLMTVAERLEARGIQKGRAEGRAEGRGEMLQRQISKRFGKSILDADVQERLRKATPEQLDRWAERILDAKVVEDVFRE